MTVEEKFEEWKDVFFDKFVKVSSDGCEQGSCVPIEEIDLDRSRGYVGDGTINLALMMTYLALAEKAGDETPISIFSCLQTLDRLHEAALELYKPFKMVSDRFQDAVTGFFLRDDIDPYGWEGLDTVVSAYGMFHHIDEDPCASPFTSLQLINGGAEAAGRAPGSAGGTEETPDPPGSEEAAAGVCRSSVRVSQ